MPEPMDEALTRSLLLDVLSERRRQHALWGEQNQPPGHWSLILAEELGEAAQAALARDWAAYRTEMVQAAAVAVQMLESLHRWGHRLLSDDGMLHWFGEPWGAPLNLSCPQVAVPKGCCFDCEEQIEPWASGVTIPDVNCIRNQWHLECWTYMFLPGVDRGGDWWPEAVRADRGEGPTLRERTRMAVWQFFARLQATA
jgi:hypothetical protein